MAFDKTAVTADDAEGLDAGRESALIERAQRGDLEALRPLLETHVPTLYSCVALPRMGDAAAAEDVVREAVKTAVEKIGQFRWRDCGLYPWLRQITVNKAYDAHRRRQRNARLAAALADATPLDCPPESLADAQLIAEQERRANRRRIDAAMAALNPRYRTALQLRLIEELPRDACAERLDVTVATFDVLFHRAIRAFRKQFGERDAAPVDASATRTARSAREDEPAPARRAPGRGATQS